MAEAITKAMLPPAWKGRVEVSSAGVSAWDGMPASETAVEVLAENGIDLSHHRARRLSRVMIEEAGLLVAMTESHLEHILSMVPEASDKTLLLGDLDETRESSDIDDPIGGDRRTYRSTRDELERLVVKLIDLIGERFGLAT